MARQSDGRLILAGQANKSQAYQCLECGKRVRLRGGLHRQLHFYHLEPTDACRQHQKGMIHLQIQLYFYHLLGESDCLLEHSIPSIKRIADVVWLSKKIIFEIQFSPISAQEVSERNRDYQNQGWTVIWILHDRRFNQDRSTAAEEFLRKSPHYYTNMDHQGKGIIYDQFDHLQKGWRLHKLDPLVIDVKGMKKFEKTISSKWQIIQRRSEHWPCYFEGDLVDLAWNHPNHEYLQKMLEKEKIIASHMKSDQYSLRKFFKIVTSSYNNFFYHLLEKASR